MFRAQKGMMGQLGGQVEGGESGEFGRAFIEIAESCALLDGLWKEGERQQVWMSHGDKVTAFAPGFKIVAVTEGDPVAIIADEERNFYGMQFHPEVVHTHEGGRLIDNLERPGCGLAGDMSL